MSDYSSNVIAEVQDIPGIAQIDPRLEGEEEATRIQAPAGQRTWYPPNGPAGDCRTAEFVENGIRIRFSPFESQAMLEHVFQPLKARLPSVILIRMGGFSCQRRDLDHHGWPFCHLLTKYAEATGTQLPMYVLSDREAIRCGKADPYFLTNIVLPWVVHDRAGSRLSTPGRFPGLPEASGKSPPSSTNGIARTLPSQFLAHRVFWAYSMATGFPSSRRRTFANDSETSAARRGGSECPERCIPPAILMELFRPRSFLAATKARSSSDCGLILRSLSSPGRPCGRRSSFFARYRCRLTEVD